MNFKKMTQNGFIKHIINEGIVSIEDSTSRWANAQLRRKYQH